MSYGSGVIGLSDSAVGMVLNCTAPAQFDS
jgi:hypothetical protein